MPTVELTKSKAKNAKEKNKCKVQGDSDQSRSKKRKGKEKKEGKIERKSQKYNIMPVSVTVKMCMEDMRR